MRRARVLPTVAGMAAVVAVALAWWAMGRSAGERTGLRATLSLQETLGGGDTAGYRRALRPRPFRFPEDHGPHPGFRTEWWYLTGNLDAPGGRRFGYQLAIFRSALRPPGSSAGAAGGATEDPAAGPGGGEGGSAWATDQAYMGHLALADPGEGVFRAFQRFERGALGLAGAEGGGGAGGDGPVRVWVDTWVMSGAPPDSTSAGSGGDAMVEGASFAGFPFEVAAGTDSVALRLTLVPLKPAVLQGEAGLSRKGPEPGNASYYYSFPRLATTGVVTTPDGRFTVRGTSWLDREWSTSALSAGLVGWDWFALQLDDGRELMVYLLRRADGTASSYSEGVLVGPAGAVTRLAPAAFEVEATGRWTSPVDGARYPSGWLLRVPDQELELRVEPVLRDQELDLAFRYWEGAVDVAGTASAHGVTGRGYVELTGYAGAEVPGGR